MIQRLKCWSRGHIWGPRHCVPHPVPRRVSVVRVCARCGKVSDPIHAQPEDGTEVHFTMMGAKKVTVYP